MIVMAAVILYMHYRFPWMHGFPILAWDLVLVFLWPIFFVVVVLAMLGQLE
jgi:hypothetical protein